MINHPIDATQIILLERRYDHLTPPPLTNAIESRLSIRLAVMVSAIKFPCSDPLFGPEQAARMWVAKRTGEGAQFKALLTRQLAMSQDPNKIVQQIATVVDLALSLSADAQQRWFRDVVKATCARNP